MVRVQPKNFHSSFTYAGSVGLVMKGAHQLAYGILKKRRSNIGGTS